jgi:SAM-dependent methyltransferase
MDRASTKPLPEEGRRDATHAVPSRPRVPPPRRQPLPPRYYTRFDRLFRERVAEVLPTARTILDVGAGRQPTIAPHERPPNAIYVGLDESESELMAAGPGAYDELLVADLTTRLPGQVGRYDLVVSWQALEHVEGLRRALENVRCYLRPGGRMVAMMSGRWALFAVGNRVLPRRIAVPLVAVLMRREVDSVFPATYEHADHAGLSALLAPWSRSEIVPYWRGAEYLNQLPRLQRAYLAYENLAARGARPNLATHYLLDATA